MQQEMLQTWLWYIQVGWAWCYV